VQKRTYEHRDVLDKLGIKPGDSVAIAVEAAEVDPDLRQRISERVGCPSANEGEDVDVVLASVNETTDVCAVLTRWKSRLKASGAIWLLTAKRGQLGYVDQRELIAAGQQAGVVDNKVCSISPTLSAMRFVLRKRDRPA